MQIYTPANDEQQIAPYESRAARYRAAAEALFSNGLDDFQTVVDLGAGWQDFDYCLRTECQWRGRYIPIDRYTGHDLNGWRPNFEVDWFVGLEIFEHLNTPFWLIHMLKLMARRGVIMSTPNPESVNVLTMGSGHVKALQRWELEEAGFTVSVKDLYTGYEGANALFGVWVK